VPTGGNIREFVADSGKVFAVSWSGGWRPNLREMMGKHYDRYLAAAKERRMARGLFRLELPGMVVVMGGHQRAFFGHVYLTDLLPAELTLEDLH
jgi:NADPH:quinone reductase-like Zn-dependent oxidoreductase